MKCHLHLQSIDEAFRITETASSCQICNRKLRFKSVINFHILIFSVIGCVQMCSLSPRMRVVKGLVRYIALMVNRLCRCRCSYLVSSSVMLRGKSCCTVGWCGRCGRCAEEQVIGGSCNVSAMSVARPWAQLTNTVCIVFK